jgi:hypothetical protein
MMTRRLKVNKVNQKEEKTKKESTREQRNKAI